jgi:hypothetical protein
MLLRFTDYDMEVVLEVMLDVLQMDTPFHGTTVKPSR